MMSTPFRISASWTLFGGMDWVDKCEAFVLLLSCTQSVTWARNMFNSIRSRVVELWLVEMFVLSSPVIRKLLRFIHSGAVMSCDALTELGSSIRSFWGPQALLGIHHLWTITSAAAAAPPLSLPLPLLYLHESSSHRMDPSFERGPRRTHRRHYLRAKHTLSLSPAIAVTQVRRLPMEMALYDLGMRRSGTEKE